MLKRAQSIFKKITSRQEKSENTLEIVDVASSPVQGPRTITNSHVQELKAISSDSRAIIFAGMMIILLFFGVGGVWITFAKLSGAIIASGEVRVDTERKTIQHLEGGIIQDILVRDGDVVSEGQPLVILQSARITAAIEQLHLQLMGEEMKSARLDAEKVLAAKVAWPPNNGTVPPESYQEILELNQKVFNTGRQALENNINLFHKQISQLQQQLISLDGRLVAEQAIIASLQEELNAKSTLLEENYIDKIQVLTLQRAVAERRGQVQQLQGSQAELKEKISELELRIGTAQNEYRQIANKEQSTVQQRLFDAQQQILPYLDSKNRLIIGAPVAGTVVALQVHSRGGVITPSQPILDIVPRNSRLIIECNVQVKDIAQIFVGQSADVQLLAFNHRTTPKILGKVIYVSADRIMKRTSLGDIPSYVVHVELEKSALQENKLDISSGMPASVFIRTKERTVLDYMVEPLMENFDRAFREH